MNFKINVASKYICIKYDFYSKCSFDVLYWHMIWEKIMYFGDKVPLASVLLVTEGLQWRKEMQSGAQIGIALLECSPGAAGIHM